MVQASYRLSHGLPSLKSVIKRRLRGVPDEDALVVLYFLGKMLNFDFFQNISDQIHLVKRVSHSLPLRSASQQVQTVILHKARVVFQKRQVVREDLDPLLREGLEVDYLEVIQDAVLPLVHLRLPPTQQHKVPHLKREVIEPLRHRQTDLHHLRRQQVMHLYVLKGLHPLSTKYKKAIPHLRQSGIGSVLKGLLLHRQLPLSKDFFDRVGDFEIHCLGRVEGGKGELFGLRWSFLLFKEVFVLNLFLKVHHTGVEFIPDLVPLFLPFSRLLFLSLETVEKGLVLSLALSGGHVGGLSVEIFLCR